MTLAPKPFARLAAAGIAVFAFATAGPANAAGTAAGTSISNVATVDYEVGTIPQTPIESSPTGNSTPGANNGTATAFLVDNRVDLTLVETNGAPTQVNPGQANVVATFNLTNTGNETQDYALTPANLAVGEIVHGNPDDQQVNNLRAFADTDGSGDFSGGDQQFVGSLAPDTSILLFVVADVPIGAPNGAFANVELTAATAEAGSSGGTLVSATTGGNTAGVDIVFGDAGNDGLEAARDGFEVSSAALSVTKVETIVSDPINGTTDPLYIPGAVVEYTITIVNTGGADAEQVSVTDVLDGDLSLALGEYAGSDIEYVLNGTTTGCTANNADVDPCGLTGSTLEADVNATLGTNAGVDDTLVVRFRVTIN